jgi:hypothetical protein
MEASGAHSAAIPPRAQFPARRALRPAGRRVTQGREKGGQDMSNRPLSVTIIGWFLIVTGVLGAAGLAVTINNPVTRSLMEQSTLPMNVQLAIAVAGFVVTIVSGIYILQGRDWARLLYVGWTVAATAIGLATSPVKSLLLLSVVFLAVIAWFLFNATANRFFGRSWVGKA